MADLTFTLANMLESANAKPPREGKSGEAIAQMDVVYLKASDGKYYKADANASDETSSAVGIALQTVAAANQRLQVLEFDPNFTPGATLVAGTTYILSGTAGKIAPDADAVSGWRKCVIFVALTTTTARLAISKGGTI